MCSNMTSAADLSWQSFPRLRKRSPMPRLIRMAIGSVCDVWRAAQNQWRTLEQRHVVEKR